MKTIIFTQLCLGTPTVTFVEDCWITAIYFCVALQQLGGRHGLISFLFFWTKKLMFFLKVPNFLGRRWPPELIRSDPDTVQE